MGPVLRMKCLYSPFKSIFSFSPPNFPIFLLPFLLSFPLRFLQSILTNRLCCSSFDCEWGFMESTIDRIRRKVIRPNQLLS